MRCSGARSAGGSWSARPSLVSRCGPRPTGGPPRASLRSPRCGGTGRRRCPCRSGTRAGPTRRLPRWACSRPLPRPSGWPRRGSAGSGRRPCCGRGRRRRGRAVAAVTGAAVVTDDGFRETDFGAWEGLTFAEVRERWPAEMSAWLADPEVAPPGGESFTDVSARVTAALDRVLAARAGQTVLIVSHVTPIKTLVAAALLAPPAALYRMHLDVAALSEIDWYADGPAVLRSFNDTGHLS